MPIFSLPDLAIRSHSRIRQSMPFQSMCIMHGVAWRTISRKVSKSGRSGHGYRAADLTSSLPFEPRNHKISSMIGTQNFAKVLLAGANAPPIQYFDEISQCSWRISMRNRVLKTLLTTYTGKIFQSFFNPSLIGIKLWYPSYFLVQFPNKLRGGTNKNFILVPT